MAHAHFPFHSNPTSLWNSEPWNYFYKGRVSGSPLYSKFPIIWASGKLILPVKSARLKSERLFQNSLLLFKTTNKLAQKTLGITVVNERTPLSRQRPSADWPFWTRQYFCIITISLEPSEYVVVPDYGKFMRTEEVSQGERERGRESTLKNH